MVKEMKDVAELLKIYCHLLQCSVQVVQEIVPFFHAISNLVHHSDGHMVMTIIIVAVLAKISIFLELLALFIHAYVDGLIGRFDALLYAESAVRQVELVLQGGLLELEEPLHGIFLLRY